MSNGNIVCYTLAMLICFVLEPEQHLAGMSNVRRLVKFVNLLHVFMAESNVFMCIWRRKKKQLQRILFTSLEVCCQLAVCLKIYWRKGMGHFWNCPKVIFLLLVRMISAEESAVDCFVFAFVCLVCCYFFAMWGTHMEMAPAVYRYFHEPQQIMRAPEDLCL